MSPEERASKAVSSVTMQYSISTPLGAFEVMQALDSAVASAIKAAETDAREKALEEAVIAVIKVQPPYEPPRALGGLFSERTAQAVEAIKALKSGEGRDG